MNCNLKSSVIGCATNLKNHQILPHNIIKILHSNNHEYVFIFMYACVGIYTLRTWYTQLFVAHPKYAHKRNSSVRKYVNFSQKSNSQIDTNIRVRLFNAGLLALSQFVSGRSYDWPTRSISVISLCPRANAELLPKFHVAPYATHAALPMVTLKCRPYVALPMLDQNFTTIQSF
jgi:hypothetical protein